MHSILYTWQLLFNLLNSIYSVLLLSFFLLPFFNCRQCRQCTLHTLRMGCRQLCGLSYPSRNSNGTRMHSLQSVTRWLRGNLLKMLFTEAKQSRLTISTVASANETTDWTISALACERVRCSLHSVMEKIAFSSENSFLVFSRRFNFGFLPDESVQQLNYWIWQWMRK